MCVWSFVCACAFRCTQKLHTYLSNFVSHPMTTRSTRKQEPTNKKRKGDHSNDDKDGGGGGDGTVCVHPLHSSSLADHLLSQFAWGSITPQTAQRIAHCCVQDFSKVLPDRNLNLGDLQCIAKAGSFGRHSNNVHRDVMQIINPKVNLPLVYSFELEIKGGSMFSQMLLPHELFASMYTEYPEAFAKIFLGVHDLKDVQACQSKCTEFWDCVQGHPCLEPLKKNCTPDWKQCTIPFALHGDGTPITGRGKSWSKQHTIFSMASLLTKGCTQNSQLMLFGIWDNLIKEGSVHTAMEILAWSFFHMYMGVWPATPPDGKTKCFGSSFVQFHTPVFGFIFVNTHKLI